MQLLGITHEDVGGFFFSYLSTKTYVVAILQKYSPRRLSGVPHRMILWRNKKKKNNNIFVEIKSALLDSSNVRTFFVEIKKKKKKKERKTRLIWKFHWVLHITQLAFFINL